MLIENEYGVMEFWEDHCLQYSFSGDGRKLLNVLKLYHVTEILRRMTMTMTVMEDSKVNGDRAMTIRVLSLFLVE